MTKITFPVGMGAKSKNLASDVTIIQDLLNRIDPALGGPNVPLKIDGICGPKTQGAIQSFQLKHFGWSGADGRVDPGGRTLAKMEEVAKPVGPVLVGAVEVFQAGNKTFVDNAYTDFFFRFKSQTRSHSVLYYFSPSPGGVPLYPPSLFNLKGDLFALEPPQGIHELGGTAIYTTRYQGPQPLSSSLMITGIYGTRVVTIPTHLPRGWANRYHGYDALFGRNTDPDKEEIRGVLVLHQ
ncbi:peptidoglycan-binding domain-containing protein [Thiocapsa sp. UBA6158]|jgi:peptidoglycan hydrolase-like protein with peptidoglycan-binding domain|uniref:peptidoglycan-binding domain-containing protein n=1 Tax=Thiocapsa sp. UBA6158 TaxID=1947692 RepID=UPI0025CBCDE4|nr:peptidoglycan-binding domain-containing protein [Thiocapsa sp. UBA6158]